MLDVWSWNTMVIKQNSEFDPTSPDSSMNIPRSDKALLLDAEMAGNIPAAGWTKIYLTSPLSDIIRPMNLFDNQQIRSTRSRS